MKTLIVLTILLAGTCSGAFFEWSREVVDVAKLTKEILIQSNETEHLIGFLTCPYDLFCIETVSVEIEEMTCETDPFSPEPTYLILTATSLQNGESKDRICKQITRKDPPLVLFQTFEPDSILVQPLGSNWANGKASAKIVVRLQFKVKDNDDAMEKYTRKIVREVRFLRSALADGFLISNGFSLFIGLLIAVFILIQMRRMTRLLAENNRNNFINHPVMVMHGAPEKGHVQTNA